MRNLVAAIRNALRAMRNAAARWKEVIVEIGGRMVSVLVPSGALAEPEEPDAAGSESKEDLFALHVRTAAAQLIADGTPNPDVLAELPGGIVRWLSVCDDGMLRSITRASDGEIQSHVKGWKGLRGVMWSDKESVDDYVRSLIDYSEAADEEMQLRGTSLPA